MAEEKKFLDETMEQPKNRKLVAKNVVLAFVVFVILLLCVLAWFTSRSDASASGLSVKTSGSSGLEVSLDGGKHWSTKWASREVTGWRKSDILAKYDSTNGGSLMQLLSGNGQDLYYTKSVDADGNVEDKDFVKVSDDKAGDYCLEFEAYFRSENKCSVALTSESSVLPYNKDDKTRHNSFGFSPDYIAGAARVAFLEKGGTESAPTWAKTGLWIPNPLYQLTTTASEIVKYEKMPDNYGGSVSPVKGGAATESNYPDDYKGPRYYLWTPKIVPLPTDYNEDQNKAALENMTYHAMFPLGDGTYYCQFSTVQPQEKRVEQPFTINSDTNSWLTNLDTFNSKCVIDNSQTTTRAWSLGSNKYRVNIGNNIGYDFYHFDHAENSSGEASELIRIVYNPETRKVMLLDPDKTEVSVNNPDGTNILDVDNEIVVTKTVSAESGTIIKGLYKADSDGNNNALNFDPTKDNSQCDLVVADVSNKKYKLVFKENKTSQPKYLAVDANGKLINVDDIEAASYFDIVIDKDKKDSEGISSKLLAYVFTDSKGNQSIKYVTLSSDGTKFELSPNSNYGDGYMIYQKIGTNFINYGMRTDNTKPEGVQEDKYYYFDDKTKTKAALDPKEYATTPQACTNLVKLETTTEIEGKTYYTGKMKVRIYAEGFDREAQKPMEKGKIKVNLQFTASNIS